MKTLFYFIQKQGMKLPEEYKNLNTEARKTIVLNLIDKCGYEEKPKIVENLTNEQIDFLFKYVFIASKDERERMRNDIQEKYENAIKNLRTITERLQKLDLQFSELFAQRKDVEEFRKNIK